MKACFQKDESFLADVRRVAASSGGGLWWLGQSGFLIVQKGRALLFDPYLSDSLGHKYANTDKPHVRISERVVDPAHLGALGIFDVITSSHNHTDHLDAETLLPLLVANPNAQLVVPAANLEFVSQRLDIPVGKTFVEMDDGWQTKVRETEIHGIAAAHNTVERDPTGHCRYLGYVVKWNGLTFYHSGDTLRHEGLVNGLRAFAIDFAFLPINGDRPERRVAGNLDGRQAAQLAHAIGARVVIPCHYDLFEFNTASPDEFVAECLRLNQPYRVLGQGEGLYF